MTYEHLDRELVNALLGDGRASLRSLADRLNVSVTTVSNHLAELEDQGTIRGYRPVLDYSTMGYDVTAVLQLNIDGKAIVDVTERLADQPQIISVYEVTGDHDIVAIGKFTDTEEMNARIKDLLTTPEIKESNTSVVLNPEKEHEQFMLET
ncbi:MAG: transcriptional regulator [halophilic archaeon J07HX5]|nr:MAG: transcriptional regulator [halophilic archaeon J07HX5]